MTVESTTSAMNSTTPTMPSQATDAPYSFLLTSALLIPLSLTAILPNILPLIFHLQSKNIATASALLWIILLNTLTCLNALIWHNDNISTWFNGKILCDIEVRLFVAGFFGGLSCATLVMAKGLAEVLDTDNASCGKVNVVRKWVLEGLMCWGPPVWFAIIYYAVQNLRYSLASSYGCVAEVAAMWPSIVLLYMWPIIFVIITCWYCGLVMIRLHRYKNQVSALLARSKTSRSRFRRLFLLAILLSAAQLGSAIPQLVAFLNAGALIPYSWSLAHSDWQIARLMPSDRQPFDIFLGRWFWIIFGWLAFLTVGMGDEIVKKYREVLVKCKILRPQTDATSRSIQTSWFSSMSSRAKLFSKRRVGSDGDFSSLHPPESSRFSKGSTILSKDTGPLLPVAEPNRVIMGLTSSKPMKSRSSMFSRMPSFGQAFAGVVPPPVDTGRSKMREAASKILITLPSPTIGSLDDDLILQMVGAEPVTKGHKTTFEMAEVQAIKAG